MGSVTSYGEVGVQGQGSLGPVFSKARPAPTLDNSGTLAPMSARARTPALTSCPHRLPALGRSLGRGKCGKGSEKKHEGGRAGNGCRGGPWGAGASSAFC